MASQSPTLDEGAPNADAASYIEGWQNITRLMDSGSSWSGNEHNCAYLNLGDREFVDISAAAGLDHVQDGRAVASLDWDGDGDLDLWLKSRNGRQLRLLENTSVELEGQPFIGLRLQGTTCNRDAIGARVVIEVGDQTFTQELRCGEGYLSQSSAELLFGWNGADELRSVVVHWPGGEPESFAGVELRKHQRLVQGSGLAQQLAPRKIELESGSALPELPPASRVVLRTPLPLPTAIQRQYFDENRKGARLLNLWATWCEPCVRELGELAVHADELAAIGLEVLPLCLDGEENSAAAAQLFEERIAPQHTGSVRLVTRNLSADDQAFFEVLFEHFIAKKGAVPVPASLLVDQHGFVEVLYLGPVESDLLAEDVATYGMQPETIGVRCNYPERWFYGMPRDLDNLAERFQARGLGASASYYSALHKMSQRRSQ